MSVKHRLLACLAFSLIALPTLAADRPNILWITSEDNSPYLGCYGDKLAQTPHLDKLASEGLRYRHAYSNAPVCSASRTTLITGMYPGTLGALNHRSSMSIPAAFKLYPQYLRDAGYYCTNNHKTDYNIAGVGDKIWNESSKKAHYQNRAKGQPFFAIFNFTTTHESQVTPKVGAKKKHRLSPQDIVLPPYHPDTPEIRADWVNYYDQMTQMDTQVGALLTELEKNGLADETIVFYYGDHGGALPRGKRNIHDSGTRVPFIVRIPIKWQHLASAQSGTWVDELISFVDLPPTLLNLCDVKVPAHFQGKVFLGKDRAEPRDHVFLYRARMDERYDTVRAIRDADFRYVRNYSPHRPWGQHYTYPFQVQASMRSWYAEFQAGHCNETQSAYWKPKPSEELYQPEKDPFEVTNLASDATHQNRLGHMRKQLHEEILKTRDTAFIPEGMYQRLAGKGTLYEYAQSDAYPLERILNLADAATSRDATQLPLLVEALNDSHPVIRYWAATGCLILQNQSASAKEALKERLKDDSLDVRVVAAEALAYQGESRLALSTLTEVMQKGEVYESLAALNALEYLWRADHITRQQAQDAVRHQNFKEPNNRIPQFLLSVP
jgi:N-sulfoglucosamine sulfohydrolase